MTTAKDRYKGLLSMKKPNLPYNLDLTKEGYFADHGNTFNGVLGPLIDLLDAHTSGRRLRDEPEIFAKLSKYLTTVETMEERWRRLGETHNDTRGNNPPVDTDAFIRWARQSTDKATRRELDTIAKSVRAMAAQERVNINTLLKLLSRAVFLSTKQELFSSRARKTLNLS